MRYLLLFLLLPSVASATVYEYSGPAGAGLHFYNPNTIPVDQYDKGYLGTIDLTIDTELHAFVLDVRADDPAQFDIHAAGNVANPVPLFYGGPFELNPDTGEFRLKGGLPNTATFGTLEGRRFDSLVPEGEITLQYLAGNLGAYEWIGIQDGIISEIVFGGPATVTIHPGPHDAEIPEPMTAALIGLAGPWLLARRRHRQDKH